ncbi:hypothetical protein MKW94_019024, partial [Papaver nudicaule]|nr:hypothetical protein [Papaver nudicaule]
SVEGFWSSLYSFLLGGVHIYRDFCIAILWCGSNFLVKIIHSIMNSSSALQNPDHQVVMPTVEAYVAFGLGKFDLSQDEVRSRVEKALKAVGMLDYLQRPVQTLSGGQKQRVAIAGALAETCEVLLLDELTTFLDESDQMGVIKAVKNSLGGNVTALWVTHRLEELEFADGAVYMENGRVIMHSDTKAAMALLKDRISAYSDQINL